jgi:hypothetical protein
MVTYGGANLLMGRGVPERDGEISGCCGKLSAARQADPLGLVVPALNGPLRK